MFKSRDSFGVKKPGLNPGKGIGRMRQLAMGMLLAVACIFIASSATAETQVSGTISTDTVWDAVGSPYVVTGNITVQNCLETPCPRLNNTQGMQLRDQRWSIVER